MVVTVTPVVYVIIESKLQFDWTVPVIAAINSVSIVNSFHVSRILTLSCIQSFFQNILFLFSAEADYSFFLPILG